MVTLCIIDDDDAVRDSGKFLLESYGHEVWSYASAEEYLKHRSKPTDCLLVDHHMPGMTGLDLLEHLRAQGDRVPAVMITGRVEAGMMQRVARLGIELLQKPLREEELLLCIESTCKTASDGTPPD